MSTPIHDFDYVLPPEFIAQTSVEPRDHSKLMLLNRETGEIRHTQFFHILDELKPGDVLVFNRSKVFKARLLGDGVEVFLLRVKDREAEALVRPGKKYRIGDRITMHGQSFLVGEKAIDGVVRLETNMTAPEILAFCDAYGEIPTPPYVEKKITEEEKYQTVYAKEVGSVAAPTAGFHFTEELLAKVRAKGIETVEVILHVGLGTFRPVQTETIEEHVMHSEWISLSKEAVEKIMSAKSEGRRVIAVGTTTVRVLEGVAYHHKRLVPYEGDMNLFITPGFHFQVIDGLITNFHLPKSTLLMLVSAFAGREHILHAYEEAKKHRYRFFSFGDAMFLS